MRSSGILLPVFSLPSPYGIGCFSKEAYEFVDFLKEAGQRWWQILPLGPTSYGDSPYQSFSTFAGNPYFIDLTQLVELGWLTKKECAACDFGTNSRDIDYGKLYENRSRLLKKAFVRSGIEKDRKFRVFQEEQRFWLKDYGLFMSLKEFFEGKSWIEWPEDIRYRWDYALTYYHEKMKDEILFHEFLQYLFWTQWRRLKQYANEKGIGIIGDIPIYVAYDSADVWARPDLFLLAEGSFPAAVAGCPPDAFSATGQLWGNPLYRWDYHKSKDYEWWISRLNHCFCLYDTVRIDHFRGFDEYYSIPYGDETAENGHWEKGPGMDLFRAMEKKLGKRSIIAEDLGLMTDSVRELVKESGYPNMKVLEFAFALTEGEAKPSLDTGNEYLPHNYGQNCVVYTGTHDNETVYGWVKGLSKTEKVLMGEYFDHPGADDKKLSRILVRAAVSSTADLCVIPLQDYLLLDTRARINKPSTLGTNWRWRMDKGMLTDALARDIFRLGRMFSRC